MNCVFFQNSVAELECKLGTVQKELEETKKSNDEKLATLTSELEEAKKSGADELIQDLNKV